MVSPRTELEKLLEARSRLVKEMEAIQNKLIGLEIAFAVMDQSPADKRTERAPRGDVKSALLTLLLEAGNNGLNANAAVKCGAERGIKLDRNTVSSLLSRFKRDGLVEHDGLRYRLRHHTATNELRVQA